MFRECRIIIVTTTRIFIIIIIIIMTIIIVVMVFLISYPDCRLSQVALREAWPRGRELSRGSGDDRSLIAVSRSEITALITVGHVQGISDHHHHHH